jgi:hypothetical protein
MMTLLLTTGQSALLDSRDHAYARQFSWWFDGKYAVRALPRRGKKNSPLQLLQVFILGKKEGFEIDHRDGDGLNNTRKNLRWATHSQNLANRPKPKGCFTSRFKGVSWHTQRGKWRASIKVNYKQISLGLWDDEKDAARAYNIFARRFFGCFAKLNAL